MIICAFSEWDMDREAIAMAHAKGLDDEGLFHMPTPAERALHVLLKSLDVVNQAGLDGKKLSDLKLVTNVDRAHNNVTYEVHATVTHRLKSEAPRLPV